MKHRKHYIAAVMTVAALVGGSTTIASAEHLAVVNVDQGVAIREQATTDSAIIAEIADQELVLILEEGEEWSLITTEGYTGYVKTKRLHDVKEMEVAVITAEALNIRQEPTEDSELIDVAVSGMAFPIVSKNEGWVEIELSEGRSGYVSQNYCEFCTIYIDPDMLTQSPKPAKEATVQKKEETPQAETTNIETTNTETVETYAGEEVYNQTENTGYVDNGTVDWESAASYSDTGVSEGVYNDTNTLEAYEEAPKQYLSASDFSDASKGQAIANFALQFQGNSYVYGGTSLTNGTDCSGFTQSVMAEFGIGIDRVAADQANSGVSVSKEEMLPGDLVFYGDDTGSIGHVAMYIGDGQIVHAATEEQGIIVSNVDYDTPESISRYW